MRRETLGVAGDPVVSLELDRAAALLQEAGVPDPRREALVLLSELMGSTPGAVAAGGMPALRESDLVGFHQAVERRAAGEPPAICGGNGGVPSSHPEVRPAGPDSPA